LDVHSGKFWILLCDVGKQKKQPANRSEDRMLMRYTQTTLKKLEDLFGELDYVIRYEKGSFQSGYCIVEHRKIAVINKFFDTEARINCLLDILNSLDVDPAALSANSRELIAKWEKEQEQRTKNSLPG